MTSRFLITHSNDGIAQAKREIARAKTGRNDQPNVEAAGAINAPASPQSTARLVVGVWSLEDWLVSLGDLIVALNKTQSTFVFYEVDAVVPAGLISRPERVAAWYEELTNEEPDKDTRNNLADNLIADDFFGLAENIRTDLTLDYIVGVTPSMVAGLYRNELYWNHFSTFDRRVVLASSYQLH